MLQDDYELAHEDIQALSKRDVLASFFAQLGYDTNERLVRNGGAMGFTSEQLKAAITHIERLARMDGKDERRDDETPDDNPGALVV